MNRSTLATLLAASLLLTGCSSTASTEKVATVDGMPITKQAYDVVYKQYEKVFHLMPTPGSNKDGKADIYVQETLKRLALNKLILNTLVQKDAQDLGVTVSDADLKKLKDEQVRQMGGPDMLNKALQENGMTEADFDNTLKEQLLVNKFLEKKGGSSLKPTDAEIQRYYQEHPKDFDLPETIRASHILVKAITPELRKEIKSKTPSISELDLDKKVAEERQTLKEKAEKLDKEVVANPSQFAAVAEKNSDDVISAKHGGDLGPLTQKALDPTFWAAIQKTKPGSLYAGVLETPFGYHIIRVADHRPPHHESMTEAKPMIANALETTKKQHLLEKWVAEKKAHIKISIEPAYQPKEAPPMGGMMPPPSSTGKSAEAVKESPSKQ